jgi:hypothetical protein
MHFIQRTHVDMIHGVMCHEIRAPWTRLRTVNCTLSGIFPLSPAIGGRNRITSTYSPLIAEPYFRTSFLWSRSWWSVSMYYRSSASVSGLFFLDLCQKSPDGMWYKILLLRCQPKVMIADCRPVKILFISKHTTCTQIYLLKCLKMRYILK